MNGGIEVMLLTAALVCCLVIVLAHRRGRRSTHKALTEGQRRFSGDPWAAALFDNLPSEPETYVTASGRALTDDDIQALADEAERGYDVSGITDMFMFPQVRPLPKAIRQADVFRSDF